MLLHHSPVNEQRINNGKLPVNGAWLCGEGVLPVRTETLAMEVYARHPVVEGLATLTESNFHSVSSVENFIEHFDRQSNILLVLDDLFDVTSYGDVLAWQSSFNELYNNWLAPLLDWTAKNKVKMNLYPCNGVCYQMSGNNWFSFFRDKRIESYINTYE